MNELLNDIKEFAKMFEDQDYTLSDIQNVLNGIIRKHESKILCPKCSTEMYKDMALSPFSKYVWECPKCVKVVPHIQCRYDPWEVENK